MNLGALIDELIEIRDDEIAHPFVDSDSDVTVEIEGCPGTAMLDRIEVVTYLDSSSVHLIPK